MFIIKNYFKGIEVKDEGIQVHHHTYCNFIADKQSNLSWIVRGRQPIRVHKRLLGQGILVLLSRYREEGWRVLHLVRGKLRR